MNRILKGYQYFYNRKPSEWKLVDTIWLHKWLEWVKPHLPQEDIDTFATNLFSDTLTHK